MATYTPNMNLKKPAGTDYVAVGDFNGNADTIDATIGKLSELETADKTNIIEAINEARTTSNDQHAPYIGTNGNWFEWNAATSQFIDTNRSATGGSGGSVPIGGSTGQVLTKSGNTDYDTEWSDPPSGSVQTVNSVTPDANGNVDLAPSDIGALASALGSIANLPLFTGANGEIVTKSAADARTALGVADYEVGTWTPTLGGATTRGEYSYSIQIGTYIRMGKLVLVTLNLTVSGITTAGSGFAGIFGLPFTPSARGVSTIGYKQLSFTTYAVGGFDITNYLALQTLAVSGSNVNLTYTDSAILSNITANSRIVAAALYRIA